MVWHFVKTPHPLAMRAHDLPQIAIDRMGLLGARLPFAPAFVAHSGSARRPGAIRFHFSPFGRVPGSPLPGNPPRTVQPPQDCPFPAKNFLSPHVNCKFSNFSLSTFTWQPANLFALFSARGCTSFQSLRKITVHTSMSFLLNFKIFLTLLALDPSFG